MSDKIQKGLENIISLASELHSHIEERGTGVQYEVEFVGGTYPVDTPHTSAGHLLQVLNAVTDDLFGSREVEAVLVATEDAEARYEIEYSDARRELDLRK